MNVTIRYCVVFMLAALLALGQVISHSALAANQSQKLVNRSIGTLQAHKRDPARHIPGLSCMASCPI